MSTPSAKHVAFGSWEKQGTTRARRSGSPESINTYSVSNNSSPQASALGNTSKSNASSGMESNMSISSTFRQLQHKCRNVELGRADALRERDELHRLLHENQRRESLLRSRGAGHTSEVLMDIKSKCSALEEQISGSRSRLVDLESAANASQDIIFVRRAELEMEEAELGQAQREKQSGTMKVKDYGTETTSVRARSNALEVRQQRSRVAAAEAEAQAKALTISAELELQRGRRDRIQSTARADALETYLRLLLRINKDLCDAVHARELAEKQMKKFVIIPRYSWPKGVVEKAEAVLKDAAAEHALMIQRREEMKLAKKTFAQAHALKEKRKSGTKGKAGAREGSSRKMALHDSPTRMSMKTSRSITKPLMHKPARPAGTFAAHQHDVSLKAVTSMKSGAAVQSIARFVRPSTC